MSSKPTLVIIAGAVAVLLVAVGKEAYWFVVVDYVFDHLASLTGMERARMIAAITPYVLSFGIVAAAMVAAYHLGVRDRSLKPVFKFVYDPGDAKFVRADEQGISYYFGLEVLARQTVDAPNVLALESPFIARVLWPFPQPFPPRGITIYEGGALDPRVIEPIHLVRLPPSRKFLDVKDVNDPLGKLQQFTLEARGRPCEPIRALFEYDPDATPMIRMLP